MRNIVLPALAAAALACAVAPAQAQYVIGNGYAQPYYGGYAQPYYGGATVGNGGLVQAAEGYLLNQTGLGNYVAPYTSRYGNFSSFGSQPYYGGGYSGFTPYTGSYGAFSPYAGGSYYRSYAGNGWGYGRRR